MFTISISMLKIENLILRRFLRKNICIDVTFSNFFIVIIADLNFRSGGEVGIMLGIYNFQDANITWTKSPRPDPETSTTSPGRDRSPRRRMVAIIRITGQKIAAAPPRRAATTLTGS